MTMLKKVFASLLALVMLLTLSAAVAEDNSLQAVLDKGTFIIGLDDSFPPLGYRDENNDIVGFDIDVARAVAEKLGVEFIAQPISWEAKELELSSGNIDCIWNGMSITPEREESMAMTFPYLNNQIVCYVKDDSDITSLADLAGKSVAVQNGSYAEELLLSDAYADAKASFADMPGFEDYLTALMDLQQGDVDAVIMDLVVGDYRINSMGAENLKAAFPLEDDNYGIGFRKDDLALRAKLHVSLRPCAPAHAVRKRTQSATTVMSEPNHFSEMAAREPSAFISFRMSCTLSRRARSSLRKPMP